LVPLPSLNHNDSHRSTKKGGLIELQRGDGLEMASVLVASRAVEKQIADGAKLQPLQLAGPFRANAGHLPQRSQQRIWRHDFSFSS
jgi:hypothetical protein